MSELLHPTYRYLERRARIVGLSWPQWLGVALSAAAAGLLAWGLPVPSPWNLTIAITIAGLPATVFLATGPQSLDLGGQLRGLLAWRRSLRGLYLPGPATTPGGFTHNTSTATSAHQRRVRFARLREQLR